MIPDHDDAPPCAEYSEKPIDVEYAVAVIPGEETCEAEQRCSRQFPPIDLDAGKPISRSLAISRGAPFRVLVQL